MKRLVIFICIIVTLICPCLVSTVNAADGISTTISGADAFVKKGEDGTAAINGDKLKNASETMYNILLTIGVIVSVLVSAILGIKFMIGSAEEKAQIKDALVPFIIGIIVIFGAFGIWKIFITIGNKL